MSERIGRYELEQPLVGPIYLGRATGGEIERHVVVKTVDIKGKDPAKLFEDARRAGMLHHQHIARVLDAGRDGDRAFVVMDYVHGRTARDVWQQAFTDGALLPVDFALAVVSAVASALHYLHTRKAADGIALKLVHGEVSLGNVVIGFDGSVQLIGLVSAHRAFDKDNFTKAHVAYLSPEQARRQPLDARSDVWSLGILLYELSTLRRAFRDDSDRLTIERVKSGAYAKPRSVRGDDFPHEVERIIAHALQVDPAQRYQDADMMRRDIEAVAHHLDLVLGDTAIVEVMEQLFAERREPWALPSGQRLESFSDLRAEFDGPDDEPFVEEPIDTPRKKLRAGTETVDAFLIESEIPIGDAPPSTDFDTGSETAIGGPRLATEPEPPRSATQVGVPPTAARVPAKGAGRSEIGVDTDGVPIHPSAHLAVPPEPVEAPVAKPVAAKPVPAPRPAAPAKGLDSRRLAIIIGGGVGLGIVFAIIFAMRGGSDDKPTPADAAIASVVTIEASVPAIDAAAPVIAIDAAAVVADAAVVAVDAAAAAGGVLVKVTSTPEGATVELDGKKLGVTPFEGTVDVQPAATHTLKVRLRGYNTVRIPVDVSTDLVQNVELKKALPVDAGATEEPPSGGGGGVDIPD